MQPLLLPFLIYDLNPNRLCTTAYAKSVQAVSCNAKTPNTESTAATSSHANTVNFVCVYQFSENTPNFVKITDGNE